ncbi:MAG: IS1380 family transposase [bacterium]|nr:IS1380 family transposase [bacterium]
MQSTKESKSPYTITKIEVTPDSLTGRAGLNLFVRYLDNICINPLLQQLFGRLRKSRKGLPIIELFKQIFVFILDGTSRHLSYFDALKKDPSHAGIVECSPQQLLSSHAVKRFFKAFSLPVIHFFRKLLRELFVWRLRLAEPDLVTLSLDSMVMNNDEAAKRHGVTPTYKKVKGFQPLQLVWQRYIIDAVFRRGERHCNYGNDAVKMIRKAVDTIRTHYRADVPIVVRMDSGFFDEAIFLLCEELDIGYACGGRLYDAIRDRAQERPEDGWKIFDRKPQQWRYFEFEDQREAWSRSRRTIFCQPLYEDRQRLLKFARPDTVVYTNLGQEHRIDDLLRSAGHADMLDAAALIGFYHGRGADELVHRDLKDFASEQLPFLRFGPNMAYYFTILVTFFLFGAFKEDVSGEVIPLESYPTTVRRRLFDQAGKIVRHAGEVTLKVTQALWDQLKLAVLWRKAHMPPQISPLVLLLEPKNRSV